LSFFSPSQKSLDLFLLRNWQADTTSIFSPPLARFTELLVYYYFRTFCHTILPIWVYFVTLSQYSDHFNIEFTPTVTFDP
jgi:hypothetical protein